MDAKRLMSLVDEPETHRKIVGDYAGSYALGVTTNPLGFSLRVETADIDQFPTNVTLDDTIVPVSITGNFRRPRPLTK